MLILNQTSCPKVFSSPLNQEAGAYKRQSSDRSPPAAGHLSLSEGVQRVRLGAPYPVASEASWTFAGPSPLPCKLRDGALHVMATLANWLQTVTLASQGVHAS